MVDDDTGIGDLGVFHSDGVSLGESDLLCHHFRASSRYAKSTLLAFGFPYPLAPCVVDWSMGIVCMVCLPTESAFAPLRQNLRINIRWAWRNAQLLRWLQASSGRVWVRYKYYVTGLVCGMVGVNAGDSQGV